MSSLKSNENIQKRGWTRQICFKYKSIHDSDREWAGNESQINHTVFWVSAMQSVQRPNGVRTGKNLFYEDKIYYESKPILFWFLRISQMISKDQKLNVNCTNTKLNKHILKHIKRSCAYLVIIYHIWLFLLQNMYAHVMLWVTMLIQRVIFICSFSKPMLWVIIRSSFTLLMITHNLCFEWKLTLKLPANYYQTCKYCLVKPVWTRNCNIYIYRQITAANLF